VILTAPSGVDYQPLPVDNKAGFPQSFAVLIDGAAYRFLLYVNLPLAAATPRDAIVDLPTEDSHLVLRIEVEEPNQEARSLFQRKIVPSLEYATGRIRLYFPRQRVAIANLNGQGDFGSDVQGGVAPRWV